MHANKKEYQANEKILKQFYASIEDGLNKTDDISKVKVFRINRDIRFSKDKTPYNSHRSVSFVRAGAHRRGGYYLRIEPGNSFMAGGFFSPNPADLLRIRKEFEIDSTAIRKILDQKDFKKAFGGFVQEYRVTDKEVLSENFHDELLYYFNLLRPYFDYMSEVLNTDLNGESIL